MMNNPKNVIGRCLKIAANRLVSSLSLSLLVLDVCVLRIRQGLQDINCMSVILQLLEGANYYREEITKLTS